MNEEEYKRKLNKVKKEDLMETIIYYDDKIKLIKEFIEHKRIITPSGIKQIKQILEIY